MICGWQHALTPRLLTDVLLAKGVVPDHREEALTLIGLRAAERDANTFNDALVVLWYCGFQQNQVVMACTTDPGDYWRRHPMNPKGTARLVLGHYPELWRLGRHRGRYEALVQEGPVTVTRDNDRNRQLDGETIDTGVFGINLHRAGNRSEALDPVDRWSAGCQVVADAADFGVLMALARQHAQRHGDRFDYTLIEERDLWTH